MENGRYEPKTKPKYMKGNLDEHFWGENPAHTTEPRDLYYVKVSLPKMHAFSVWQLTPKPRTSQTLPVSTTASSSICSKVAVVRSG
jgi:hypothetical protein